MPADAAVTEAATEAADGNAGRNMEAESSILKGYDGGYGYKHIVEKKPHWLYNNILDIVRQDILDIL